MAAPAKKTDSFSLCRSGAHEDDERGGEKDDLIIGHGPRMPVPGSIGDTPLVGFVASCSAPPRVIPEASFVQAPHRPAASRAI